ncbi:MAG: hypothetical protein ACR2QC_01420 [Gammaproteobacteria bacterium]
MRLSGFSSADFSLRLWQALIRVKNPNEFIACLEKAIEVLKDARCVDEELPDEPFCDISRQRVVGHDERPQTESCAFEITSMEHG